MSKLAKGATVKLPAPTMGVDWSVASSEVKHPYSPCSLDWIANGYSVKIRDRHYQLPNIAKTINYLASFDAGGTLLLGSAVAQEIYEYNLSTETLSAPLSVTVQTEWTDSVNYQGRVFLAKGKHASSYDGTTYTYHAFTTSSMTSASDPTTTTAGCCIYRDRFIMVTEKVLRFAPTAGAVAGLMINFDLTSYYTGGTFIGCASISVNDSSSIADYLVVVSSGGDILAFTGDFPGSANWQLVTRTSFRTIPGSYVRVAPYNGDAFLIAGSPVSVYSLRTVITEGILAASAKSPIAKASPFLSESFNTSLLNGVIYPNKKALLVQVFNASLNNLFFGITTPISSNYWLYVDLTSGAISPFTYPNNDRPPSNTFGANVVSHSNGGVYGLNVDGTQVWELFDDSTTSTSEAYSTFLEFPSSNLEITNSQKMITMAYPFLSRTGGYVEANLAIAYDLDRANALTFASTAGSSFSGFQSKRIVLPVAGQGELVSIALTNTRRQRLSCEFISIQFEDGGPY